MINRYRFLTLGAAALMTVSAFGEFNPAPGERVIYGYSMGSAEFNTEKGYDTGFVMYPFDPSESNGYFEGEMLESYLDTPYVGVYAGTGVEGLLYAVEYEFSTSLTQPLATNLVCYNVFNGSKEVIGQWNPGQTDFKPQDMSYNEKDGKIYAVGFEESRSGLYTLDLNSATFTLVCNLQRTMATLAIDSNGNFYGLDSECSLYSIDPENGNTTKLMETELGTMYSNQSMTFDKASGLLYWASVTYTYENGWAVGYDDCYLQEIDIEKGSIREIGCLGISNRMAGLYIPSAQNLLAPNAPVVAVTPAEDGSLKATLSITAPTVTLDGSDQIGTIYGYVVVRNGEKVYVSEEDEITPGKVYTWVDETIPSYGEYRYDVYFQNGKGDGAKGTYYQWIGPDAPGKVSNIKSDVINNMTAVTLSWDAPTAGRHLGAYDPAATTYTILRSPDNVKFENIKETTFTDTSIRRLLNYSYTIIAKNEVGESPDAFSGNHILGPAMELPYDQSFEDAAQVLNRWTPIDGNNDGFTWLFNTTLGQTAFGDAESCVEYVVSPGLGNSMEGSADDWLISPPMKFEAGKEYEITLSMRSYTSDEVEIYMGDLNTADAMTEKAGEIKVVNDPDNPEINPVTGTQTFKLHSVALPKVDEDAVRCVGIHLVTKHLSHNFLQINEIIVGDASSGVAEIEATGKNVKLHVNNKVISVIGDFRQADVYDLSGRKVVTSSSASIDMTDFADGVYVLVIDGRSFKLAL